MSIHIDLKLNSSSLKKLIRAFFPGQEKTIDIENYVEH